eukprot:9048543-Ditylum_brightwellii.AAC.1
MAYKRGQQVLVKIDDNNPSGWYSTCTTNMQWIKAIVVGWGYDHAFNFTKVKPLEGDEPGGIQSI